MARAVKDVMYGKTLRKSFARSEEILEMPYLLEIQKKSYQWFLDTGLQEVFDDVDTITDYAGNLELSFIGFSMDDPPKYTIEECKAQDATYAAPMKVQVRLRNKETGEIKEQEIFMGDFPIMTQAGTFVINGAERVIVSQIVRSPGVYFAKNADKADNIIYTSTVIPYRGAWLEYETDLSDVFYVRIDKNRKLPVTCLIRAVGPRTDAEILEMFGQDPRILATLEKDSCKTYEEALLEIYRKLRPGEPPTVDSAAGLLNALFFDPRRYDLSSVGRYKFNKKLALWTRLSGQKLAEPVADPTTGEIVAEAGEVLTRERAKELEALGVNEAVVEVDDIHTGAHLVKVFSNHMVDMKNFVDFDPEEIGITEKVRFAVLRELLDQRDAEGLSDEDFKDLVSRRIPDLVPNHIIVDDIMASINYLNCLAFGVGSADDIDHLGNRRLRCVGELLQN
ncbi:MAG: DNA-directed RNA polymerase subunit beta, partial [Candidatus Enterenecus sp.]